MTRAPVAAVLLELVIDATNPDRVPVSDAESRTAASTPVPIARGAKRIRVDAAAERENMDTSGSF